MTTFIRRPFSGRAGPGGLLPGRLRGCARRRFRRRRLTGRRLTGRSLAGRRLIRGNIRGNIARRGLAWRRPCRRGALRRSGALPALEQGRPENGVEFRRVIAAQEVCLKSEYLFGGRFVVGIVGPFGRGRLVGPLRLSALVRLLRGRGPIRSTGRIGVLSGRIVDTSEQVLLGRLRRLLFPGVPGSCSSRSVIVFGADHCRTSGQELFQRPPIGAE